jgi:trimethylamine--corrinoid protein Co-methyltransferase
MNLFQRPKFISDQDMQRIHEASLYLLENKGIVFKSPEALALLKEHGARVDGEIAYLPKALVEDCLAKVPRLSG